MNSVALFTFQNKYCSSCSRFGTHIVSTVILTNYEHTHKATTRQSVWNRLYWQSKPQPPRCAPFGTKSTIRCSVNARFQPQATAWNRKDGTCDSTWCQTMRHKEAMVSCKCCKCSIAWKTCFHFISPDTKKQAANIMPEPLCFTCLMTRVMPSQTL